MEKLLTVSIAAYNVENFIRKTLDSLMDEEIIDDLEILVVDDGGTDRTMKIAGEYADKYPKSVFCVYKENEGYGSTINSSIKMANGKYFRQLDGDDWFVKKNLKSFINVLRNTQADVILSNSVKYFETNNKYSLGLDYNHLPEGEYRIEEVQLDTRFSMHTVTFKTELLKKHEKPLTHHSLYTDSEFVTYPIPYINTVYIDHENIYVYRIGRDGQSFNIESVKKHYREMVQVFGRCLEVYEAIGLTEKNKKKVAFEILCERMKNVFRFFLALPVSRKVLHEIKDFQKMAELKCPEVLTKVRQDSRVINLLLQSHYLSYPVLGRRVKRKWRTPVPDELMLEDQL